jgi:hypothetical protein
VNVTAPPAALLFHTAAPATPLEYYRQETAPALDFATTLGDFAFACRAYAPGSSFAIRGLPCAYRLALFNVSDCTDGAAVVATGAAALAFASGNAPPRRLTMGRTKCILFVNTAASTFTIDGQIGTHDRIVWNGFSLNGTIRNVSHTVLMQDPLLFKIVLSGLPLTRNVRFSFVSAREDREALVDLGSVTVQTTPPAPTATAAKSWDMGLTLPVLLALAVVGAAALAALGVAVARHRLCRGSAPADDESWVSRSSGFARQRRSGLFT